MAKLKVCEELSVALGVGCVAMLMTDSRWPKVKAPREVVGILTSYNGLLDVAVSAIKQLKRRSCRCEASHKRSVWLAQSVRFSLLDNLGVTEATV